MIPKIIHYCWFGKKEKPPAVYKYLQTWQNHLPQYKLVEWNESNINIEENTYIKQAYKAGKYAFVADYTRLVALYTQGGIYLDTDMEILKPLDYFLSLPLFFGFESSSTVASCIIGSNKGNMHIKNLLDAYTNRVFIQPDNSYNLTTNVTFITNYLKTQGLVENNKKQTFKDITVFPCNVFCPKDFITEKVHITQSTYAIHHFEGSWTDKRALRKYRIKEKIRKKINPNVYAKIKKIFKR